MSYSFGVSRNPATLVAGALALVTIVFSSPAHALTFRVGTGSGCTQPTIAAALTAAENSAGADTIRITRSGSYTQQAITFTTGQELTITGGYADCMTDTEDGTYTTINGAGGSAATVLTINGNTGSVIRLRKLIITGGDVSSSSIAGGGIYYTGNGVFDIADLYITNNTGAYGGGINVGGTGSVAELDIGANTTITFNTAYYNGGGIFSNNIVTNIREDNTLIAFNAATGVGSSGGLGGGIYIRACAFNSTVYLGSPGVGNAGVVSSNSAKYGGGVAVEGADGCDHIATSGKLLMFSTNAARLTKIQSNTASVVGGGIYLLPEGSLTGYVPADAHLWNASIEGNTAPEGSAAYLNSDDDITGYQVESNVYFNSGGPPGGAIACAVGVSCGRISNNGSSGSGRVIYGEEGNSITADRIEISGNQGSELIRLEFVDIDNSLISGNTITARLIETHHLGLHGTTIAGNIIGGAEVLGVNTDGHADITNMIVWQPGKLTLHNDGDTPHVLDVLSNDISTLTGSMSAGLIVADPRFVDPARGDYSLTAASRAVDFAPSDSSHSYDLYGHNRDLDFDLFHNDYGPRDLGALERQTVQPFVLNGDFNLDANLWPEVAAGASSWDSTQNASGPSGSGSLHVNLATGANLVTVRKQCIHLPAAGNYALNGWGKSTGTITAGDLVKLNWEYRSAGSETCTGNLTSSGTLVLASNSTWRRPPIPATIVVSGAEWTTNSSILVYLVVDEGGGIGGAPEAPTATAEENALDESTGGSLIGWFDGITLDVMPDRIFKDGFNGP